MCTLPLTTLALTVHVEGIPRGIGLYGPGIISSTNVSASATGGLTAPGGAVASGDASASADVRTIIRGGDSSMRIEVRTEEGGRIHTEAIDRRFSDRNIDIRIATTTPASSIRADIRVFSSTTTKETLDTPERSWWWFWGLSAGTSSVKASTTPFIQLRSDDFLGRFLGRTFGFLRFW